MSRRAALNEDQYIVNPEVTALVEDLVSQAKAAFSDRQYALHGGEVRLLWAAQRAFRADAGIGPTGSHEITISYGAGSEIYRDAFVLTEFCAHHFNDSRYDEIYDALDYDGRRDVLPDGLSVEAAKINIMRTTLHWLYLHEQAHLFQGHGNVAEAVGAGTLLGDNLTIMEMAVAGAAPLEGRDAAVRHAFELAADHEATNLMIASLATTPGPLAIRDLWCFTVGAMCLFFLFDDESGTPIGSAAKGTHPPPAMRMRLLIRQILWFVQNTSVRAHVGPLHDLEFAAKVMEHATVTATMYWQIRYLEQRDGLPTFLESTTHPQSVPEPYRQQIFEIWKELRPLIVAEHLGWGEASILEIETPDSLA